jgi:hypothetical protein
MQRGAFDYFFGAWLHGGMASKETGKLSSRSPAVLFFRGNGFRVPEREREREREIKTTTRTSIRSS